MFQCKNSKNDNIVEFIKTKKSKLNSDKRLHFSDSKIIFSNINLDEDIIDVFLLYNDEIVKSIKSDTKNYYRIEPNQIGLSKEFQILIFEIVNKIELTIQLKFSKNALNNKGISFKSRLNMYNKKAENPKKQIDAKIKSNNKNIKEEKKEVIINNEDNENEKKYKVIEKNVINEEEECDGREKDKDANKDNLKMNKNKTDNNKESFKTIRKKMSFLAKNDDQTFKMLNDYEEKIKELELKVYNKEEEIKKLTNNKNNIENKNKSLWNEIIKEEIGDNLMINGIQYKEYEIINMLNKKRKPLKINKEIEIDLIYKLNLEKTGFIVENINEINYYGKKSTENIVENNASKTKKDSYEVSKGDKFFIEGKVKEGYTIEAKDSIQIFITKNISSKICFSDKFTIEQNKKINFMNLIKNNNYSLQLLPKKKEKEQLKIHNLFKFSIQSLIKPKLEKEQKDSLQLLSIPKEPLKLLQTEKFFIQGINLKDKKKENNISEKLYQNKKFIFA